jgi:hypothetical protein
LTEPATLTDKPTILLVSMLRSGYIRAAGYGAAALTAHGFDVTPCAVAAP